MRFRFHSGPYKVGDHAAVQRGPHAGKMGVIDAVLDGGSVMLRPYPGASWWAIIVDADDVSGIELLP